jgi:hypothetical protein
MKLAISTALLSKTNEWITNIHPKLEQKFRRGKVVTNTEGVDHCAS